MVAFAPIVQADLSGTAFGGAPTWTDITRFVRLGPSPIRITKWRQDQLSDVAPSTMQLVLDNMDVPGDATAPNAGRFTPFLTTSPWTPHLLPGVRMRSGVTLTLVPTNNLITNPSFEVDLSNWFSGNSLARSAVHALYGGWSMQTTCTSAVDTNVGNTTVTAVATGMHSFSTWLYLDPAWTMGAVHWGLEGGTAVVTGQANIVSTTTTGVWQRIQWTANVTTPGTLVMVARYANAPSASGQKIWLDDVQFEQSAAPTDYCDGSQPGCSWTGTPNASTSTRPSSFTFWRFDGYVDTWDASYDNGEFGICTVSASDILARLGAADALRAIYIEEVLLDLPVALYPLTEQAGSASAGDISGNNRPGLILGQNGGRGDVTFAAATGIPTDGTSTATMNKTLSAAAGDDYVGDFLQTIQIINWPTFNWTVEVIVTLDPNLATVLARQTVNLNRCLVAGVVTPSGSSLLALSLKYTAGAVQLLNTFTSAGVGPDLNDGKLHHLAVAVDFTNTITTYYVDGVSVATSASASFPGATLLQIGGEDSHAPLGPYPAFRGGIGYVGYYSTALSATRVAAHNSAARTAFAGEGTATHISRLLSYRTNLGSTLDAGQGTVATQAITGVSEQQALLDTAKAEGGLLYADPASGKIVFLDRSRLRDPVPVLTLDITAQQTGDDLNVRADRDLLLNDVTITRPGGVAQRQTDQTSKNTYGTKALSETRIIGSDQDVANAAGWLVANGKDIRQRTPVLSVDLLTEPSAAIASGVLALTPLQRVKLTNPPTSLAAADVIVQGCTDTIGVNEFTCAFFTGPLPRPTLRFDAAPDAFTKLDNGLVFAW